MENFILTPKQIHNIYSCSYTVAESRGKKRKHLINNTMIDSLKVLDKYNDCEFIPEVRINNNILWGKYFTVDVQVFKNNKLIEILLFKAPASNFSQNHVNMLNARMGEMVRLSPLIKTGVKLTFISLQPNTTPFFTKKGDIKHFESNHVVNMTLVKPYITVDFSDITITFDIVDVKSCKNKEDVKNIFLNENVITNIEVHI